LYLAVAFEQEALNRVVALIIGTESSIIAGEAALLNLGTLYVIYWFIESGETRYFIEITSHARNAAVVPVET
jgi:hypothetical protein